MKVLAFALLLVGLLACGAILEIGLFAAAMDEQTFTLGDDQ
jgi:hypothetical protein